MVRFLFMFGALLALLLQVSLTPVTMSPGKFGDHYQGDIKLTEEQKTFFLGGSEGIVPNTGWIPTNFRWPTNLQGYVVVPYRIQSIEGFTQAEIDFIRYEFGLIEAKTCIRFVPRSNQIDFVEIIDGDGCWSWLGRIGGRQELSMSRAGCFWLGTAAHEAIHALGFDHMHNAVERDSFVDILWDNIIPGAESQFRTVDPSRMSNFNTPYDLRSVMHYPRWAFTRNGMDTIVPHNLDYLDVIGEVQFSDGDATRLNRMHQCMNV